MVVGWSFVPLGSALNGPVKVIHVRPNGNVIAGGLLTGSGTTSLRSIAEWDGASWQPFGDGMDYSVDSILELPNGDIIAGGGFTTAGGLPAAGVARWSGTTWSPIGSGTNGQVNSLARLDNGDIVAGGSFTAAGGVVNRLARWTGSAWSPLGEGVNGTVTDLLALPGGDLLACGRFTMAGGRPSGYWAHWAETGVPLTIRAPTPAIVPAGGSTTLSAICADGFVAGALTSYQWRRNGVNVTDGEGGASPGGGVISGASGTLSAAETRLTITGAAASDAGQYSVVFATACGGSVSTHAELTVRPPCIADLNGDGAVDALDLGQLLGQWGACSDCEADFDRNGQVNGLDMGTLLGEWGLGCS
jgi:hypothetical protein